MCSFSSGLLLLLAFFNANFTLVKAAGAKPQRMQVFSIITEQANALIQACMLY